MNPFLLKFAEEHAKDTADVAKTAQAVVVRLNKINAPAKAIAAASKEAQICLDRAFAARTALDNMKIKGDK